ncbi:coiled-coil domain-containing protein 83-like [Octopus sinensis]|uniref:Coiled-coil domain-containing protein 83-like n=1 Tax=Octopus sinensis TaxID=2607531 RepID=A0A6P7TPX3_9MOLL|nr:coiled-coil domain-containing protein 83-like [Octopus sinensis]
MSDREAILVYKLSVAEEKLHEAKQEAQAWKEKNERHIKRNHKLHSEQKVLVDRLLNQFRETETKWNSEEVVGKDVVVEALQDKWNRVEDHKKVIADLNEEISSTNREIEDVERQMEYWKLYEEKGQFEDKKQIDRLEKQLNDLDQCYNYLQTALTDQMVQERDTVEGTMTEKVESQKEKANKKVVSLMPKHCCRQLKDNGWLKREVSTKIFIYT